MPGGVRIDDELHIWLIDHRDSKKRTISDVIRDLIKFKEQHKKD